MPKLLSLVGWFVVAAAGAGALAFLALSRGETISAAWVITAAVCSYLIGYRFYSKIAAAKVFSQGNHEPGPYYVARVWRRRATAG